MTPLGRMFQDFVRAQEASVQRDGIVSDDFAVSTISASPLFPENLVHQILGDAALFERQLVQILLRFLNAPDESEAKNVVKLHPVLLCEEAPDFLSMLQKWSAGASVTEQRYSERHDLLRELWKQSKRDQVLFDFLDLDGQISSLKIPQTLQMRSLEDEAIGHVGNMDIAAAFGTVQKMYDVCVSQSEAEMKRAAETLFDWVLSLSRILHQSAMKGDIWHHEIMADAADLLSDDFCSLIAEMAGVSRVRLEFNDAISLYNLGTLANQHRHGDKHLATIKCRMGISAVLRDLGDFEGALIDCTEAFHGLAFMDEPHDVSVVLDGALAYLGVGNLEWAQKLADRAAQNAVDPADARACQYVHAVIRIEESDFGSARKLLQPLADQPAGIEPLNRAEILHALALCCHQEDDHVAAIPCLTRALDLRKTELGENHPESIASLSLLALQFHCLGDVEQVLLLVPSLSRAMKNSLMRIFSGTSERLRRSYLATLRLHFDLCLSHLLLARNYGHSTTAQTTCDLVLKWKSIEADVARVFRMAIREDDGAGDPFAQLESQVTETAMDAASFDIRHEEVEGLIVGDRRSQKELSEIAMVAHLRDELADQIEDWLFATTVSDIRSQLSHSEALIEFVKFERFQLELESHKKRWKTAYIALILTADDRAPVQLIDLGDAAPIDHLVGAFRTEITRRKQFGSEDKHMELGRELAKLLFNPVKKLLSQGTTRLMIAADGEVSRLPFETLPSAGNEYLIDTYEFRYLTSGRDLVREPSEDVQVSAPLVVGNPNYDLTIVGTDTPSRFDEGVSPALARSGERFSALPGTEAEAIAIAAKLDVHPLLGDKATKSAICETACPQILHLATHGFFLPNQPTQSEVLKDERHLSAQSRWSRLANLESPLIRSGLALAGANTWLNGQATPPGVGNGILTASDVVNLNLRATELVVLSACETGIGEVTSGEGVFGLRRAFVIAGAKTLVMSLWNVPDQTTRKLMEAFYGFLLKGDPTAVALRKAQLRIKSQHKSPLHWGAFILQGESGPVSLRRFSK
jgi:CHAT domain-containing protein